MSLSTANQAYLQYLSKYPLLTKAITAGVFNGLNEIIASLVSKDFSSFKLSWNNKILKMIVYGSLILTPISHNLYAILNKVYGNNLTPALKVCQVATSICTIQPIISCVFTSWISIINQYKQQSTLKHQKDKQLSEILTTELKEVSKVVRTGLRDNYSRNLKSSVLTNCISLPLAQQFLSPQSWVVFFNLVYFVLGTYQNTRTKLHLK